MFETIAFSLAGTLIFALIGIGLVYLLGALGGGERARATGGRGQNERSNTRRPGRSASQRAKR
ncbi:MAG: hypothetical protein HOH43_03710 [Candidatus Latescibacteria bacterium]|jgi:hypothetical protein|nr:hypothetical protein [Candidatus Latescibacterota bacterium]